MLPLHTCGDRVDADLHTAVEGCMQALASGVRPGAQGARRRAERQRCRAPRARRPPAARRARAPSQARGVTARARRPRPRPPPGSSLSPRPRRPRPPGRSRAAGTARGRPARARRPARRPAPRAPARAAAAARPRPATPPFRPARVALNELDRIHPALPFVLRSVTLSAWHPQGGSLWPARALLPGWQGADVCAGGHALRWPLDSWNL